MVEISPIDVKKALMGARFPATASAVLTYVASGGAPSEVVDLVRALPVRWYTSPADVVTALRYAAEWRSLFG